MVASCSRFARPLSQLEEASLLASSIPSNTKATTEWGIRIWDECTTSRESNAANQANILPLNTPLLQMNPSDIAYWLGKFVLEV